MKTKKQTVRPPRRRREHTVRIVGRNVTQPCADVILRVAAERGHAPYRVVVDVLEEWARRQERKRLRERTGKSGKRQGRRDPRPVPC